MTIFLKVSGILFLFAFMIFLCPTDIYQEKKVPHKVEDDVIAENDADPDNFNHNTNILNSTDTNNTHGGL